MIPRIKELLHATPFEPFKLRRSDGREYVVPTADHAAVPPKGNRVIVFLDSGAQIDVAGLDLAAVLRNGEIEK